MTGNGADREGAGRDGGIVILCTDEGTRDVLAFWFESAGHRVTVARDGHQASRALRDGRGRLLVTDRVLPPWPGLDTFLALRARDPGLGIAVVETGDLDERILARVTGATALLRKPLSRTAVLALVPPAAGVQPDAGTDARAQTEPSRSAAPAARLRTEG
ncbi:response regulator [Rhodoplanes azumiensis]|uniref:Response regulator n=1 Tax=Rhodoplanes azumiensis TaxID=1897628 RepID=A0ABW5AFH7_9BRAD